MGQGRVSDLALVGRLLRLFSDGNPKTKQCCFSHEVNPYAVTGSGSVLELGWYTGIQRSSKFLLWPRRSRPRSRLQQRNNNNTNLNAANQVQNRHQSAINIDASRV